MAALNTTNSLKSTFLERLALAVPVRPVVAKAEFLTRTRDDLFTLSRRLMSSISPSALQDPANPIIVTVRGSVGRGKKIFPDAAQEHMLGRAADFEGMIGDYEFWRGAYNSKDFEIDFYNYMLASSFTKYEAIRTGGDPYAWRSAEETRAEFLSMRQHGGITFLHNDEEIADYHSDIDILLDAIFLDSPYEHRLSPSELVPALKILAPIYHWARLIKIEVKNEELMQHAPFAREIASMQLPSGTISGRFNTAAKLVKIIPPATTALLAHDNIPIYGVNIARPG